MKLTFPFLALYVIHQVCYFFKSPQKISIDLDERKVHISDREVVSLKTNDTLYIEEKSRKYHAVFLGEFKTGAFYMSNDIENLADNSISWIKYTKI